MIYPVILAGGSGTRLWPLSRKSYPKQFAQITGETSLFQQALKRLSAPDFGAPAIMTAADFRFIAAEQLAASGIEDAEILIEPESRNTAPAILIAALRLEDQPDALMLVAPSDHVVTDETAFLRAVRAAVLAADEGEITTFGIRPDRPETGYGYLETKSAVRGAPVLPLHRFVEKPDQATAEAMVADGRFLWNAGIFLFRVDAILRVFETLAPHLIGPCRAALSLAKRDLDFTRLDAAAYARAEDISFDFAIMEKHDQRAVVPMEAGWSDLGGWQSVWNVGDGDADGNVVSASATAIDCTNALLRSEDPDIEIVGLGLDNIAAIATRDAVLVADMRDTEKMREVVAKLKAKGAKQAEEFQRCHRPWGYYETLTIGSRFQVKRIMVHPGAQLSLQSHVHRAEHWVVVEGSAHVTVGDTVTLLSENQSTFIPLGAVHRLQNPGKVPLHLIEVQSGTYLGEDDIVRYEDIYARADSVEAA
ncbi:MAG: mannose-1-phosphate guanylyltransferase/mannose-6-phosphate isomerase [Pseudomonadota bacterium]